VAIVCPIIPVIYATDSVRDHQHLANSTSSPFSRDESISAAEPRNGKSLCRDVVKSEPDGKKKGQSMDFTDRSKLRRIRERGSHDWTLIHEILDAGFLAHVGFCIDMQPFVIPTLYGRVADTLYLHGSVASRMLNVIEAIPVCLTVTLMDGLVLARSAFDHSMNYRSVVAFGTAQKVEDPARKLQCLRTISEHLIAGRWVDVRGPTQQELNATTVLEFSIEEASSKIRSGPPQDNADDYGLPVWAGVLPLEMRSCAPQPDPQLIAGVGVPDYARNFNVRLGGKSG
jgi:nitroimidazol reductase NimA-like FMN-containing flavoprotein (pyridoxamine 5'-phosphate oxidase superfamily)